ncbi:helix-turn-helix domain-containing protein [Candidatus Kaiserbacteria bacterium]|nr:helix-turn-helix domain-containing protein [Candidatus Kaiserbacteria bacterium]
MLAEGDFLTIPECCNYLGASKSKLSKPRKEGSGPPFIRFGRAIRYSRRNLLAWLDANEGNTSE